MKHPFAAAVAAAALVLTGCGRSEETSPSAQPEHMETRAANAAPITAPYSPQEVATLIGATDVQDAADNPSPGDEVSVDWRGHQLNIWVPQGSSTLAEGLVLAVGPSSLGDGWVITAPTQYIADAANDTAVAALIAGSQR